MGEDRHKKSSKEKKKKRSREKRRDSDSSSDDEEYASKRRAEKLAKKVAKHLEKHSTMPTYTDADNPFGDANLSKRFVWTKKIERDIHQGKSLKEFSSRAEKERQQERMMELEKARKRREEREAEKARMEEELSFLQRQRALAEAVEMEEKEVEFHLKQAQVRAIRRFKEGRPKPIDIITQNLYMLDEFDMDMREPYRMFDNLLMDEVQELYDDVIFYRDLDVKDPLHREFWDALFVIADHEMEEAKNRDAMDRAHLRGQALPAAYGPQETSLHPSVKKDIEAMLAGHSYKELVDMEAQISDVQEKGQGDPEYWEAVVKKLKIHKAKAKLREIQADLMKKHLEQAVKRMQEEEEGPDRIPAETEGEEGDAEQGAAGREPSSTAIADDTDVAGPSKRDRGDEEAQEEEGRANKHVRFSDQVPDQLTAGALSDAPDEGMAPSGDEEGPEAEEAEELVDDEEERQAFAESDGRYSPLPVAPEEVAGRDVVHEEDDLRMLELLRQQVRIREAGKFRTAAQMAGNRAQGMSAADLAYQSMISDRSTGGVVHPWLRNIAEVAPGGEEQQFRSGKEVVPDGDEERTRQLRSQADRTMGSSDNDAPFGGEVMLESQVYWWHDKYRPRKPKYFNRVHTGYEWNKYNQTHYDADNPPPKVVQGYKFNIFYPDLVDQSKAPTFKIERDPTSKDNSTCFIRFSAGPPYEDIAFRIVNKEWELSHKKGYKCTFERGILHLYFNFKRTRYRR